METINPSEFKAKCLALHDRVNDTREMTTILKRGRPAAQLTPPPLPEQGYPQDDLGGALRYSAISYPPYFIRCMRRRVERQMRTGLGNRM